MNLTKHRQAFERMYTDRVTIYRYEKVKDPTTKETKLTPVTLHVDQSCRISQTGLARNGQTEAQNDIDYENKLFIAPELEIRQGDLLEVTRCSIVRRYEAGEPFPYPTHQEIGLHRKEWA